MTGNTDGSVCIKYKYNYSTYEKELSGCTCVETLTTGITEYLITGENIKLLENTNLNYQIDTDNALLCLKITGETIASWFETYVNTIASQTGYTSDIPTQETENRVIYSTINNKYYRVEHETNTNVCEIDTDPRYAILNPNTDNIWDTGEGDYFYNQLDECGLPTGVQFIDTRDININSQTEGSLIILTKCSD